MGRRIKYIKKLTDKTSEILDNLDFGRKDLKVSNEPIARFIINKFENETDPTIKLNLKRIEQNKLLKFKEEMVDRIQNSDFSLLKDNKFWEHYDSLPEHRKALLYEGIIRNPDVSPTFKAGFYRIEGQRKNPNWDPSGVEAPVSEELSKDEIEKALAQATKNDMDRASTEILDRADDPVRTEARRNFMEQEGLTDLYNPEDHRKLNNRAAREQIELFRNKNLAMANGKSGEKERLAMVMAANKAAKFNGPEYKKSVLSPRATKNVINMYDTMLSGPNGLATIVPKKVDAAGKAISVKGLDKHMPPTPEAKKHMMNVDGEMIDENEWLENIAAKHGFKSMNGMLKKTGGSVSGLIKAGVSKEEAEEIRKVKIRQTKRNERNEALSFDGKYDTGHIDMQQTMETTADEFAKTAQNQYGFDITKPIEYPSNEAVLYKTDEFGRPVKPKEGLMNTFETLQRQYEDRLNSANNLDSEALSKGRILDTLEQERVQEFKPHGPESLVHESFPTQDKSELESALGVTKTKESPILSKYRSVRDYEHGRQPVPSRYLGNKKDARGVDILDENGSPEMDVFETEFYQNKPKDKRPGQYPVRRFRSNERYIEYPERKVKQTEVVSEQEPDEAMLTALRKKASAIKKERSDAEYKLAMNWRGTPQEHKVALAKLRAEYEEKLNELRNKYKSVRNGEYTPDVEDYSMLNEITGNSDTANTRRIIDETGDVKPSIGSGGSRYGKSEPIDDEKLDKSSQLYVDTVTKKYKGPNRNKKHRRLKRDKQSGVDDKIDEISRNSRVNDKAYDRIRKIEAEGKEINAQAQKEANEFIKRFKEPRQQAEAIRNNILHNNVHQQGLGTRYKSLRDEFEEPPAIKQKSTEVKKSNVDKRYIKPKQQYSWQQVVNTFLKDLRENGEVEASWDAVQQATDMSIENMNKALSQAEDIYSKEQSISKQMDSLPSRFTKGSQSAVDAAVMNDPDISNPPAPRVNSVRRVDPRFNTEGLPPRLTGERQQAVKHAVQQPVEKPVTNSYGEGLSQMNKELEASKSAEVQKLMNLGNRDAVIYNIARIMRTTGDDKLCESILNSAIKNDVITNMDAIKIANIYGVD